MAESVQETPAPVMYLATLDNGETRPVSGHTNEGVIIAHSHVFVTLIPWHRVKSYSIRITSEGIGSAWDYLSQ